MPTALSSPQPVLACSLAELQSIRLFAGIEAARLATVLPHLQEACYAGGEPILRQGEATEALYFLLAGEVRVLLRDEQGNQHQLAELGPGETFGERALLTGEPRTADVVAKTAVRLVLLGREALDALLRDCPEVHANLCRQLARQLGNWALRHQRDEQENREILTNLVGWQLLPEFDAFPGRSPGVRQLNQRIRRLAAERGHVLILGERGSWKDLVARLIHFHQAGAPRPVLFLDCAAPPPVLRERGERGDPSGDLLLLKIAQESALFGHAPDSAIYARGTRRGLLELAEGGDLILRNVDSLALPVQQQLAGFLRSGFYRRRGEQQERRGEVRLLATCSRDLDPEVVSGRFDAGLLACLSAEIVHLTPLRERKQDIPVIARRLLRDLNRKHHKQVRRLSQDALNLLVDHDWPLNGSELYQVLSRAVAVSVGPEIAAEQIFLQGQPQLGGRLNLLALPAVDRLVRRPGFPGRLRWATVPLLLLIIAATLWGPAEDNPANLMVWTLWWPLLLLGAGLTARSWCSGCPLEALGSGLARLRQWQGEAPDWLRRFGPALSMAGLIVILLVEQASGMFVWARATGLLLLGLLLANFVTDLLCGPRSWCKYLCPLGRMISLVSRIALVEMTSNATVCQSRCRVDDCIKEKACPMGLHPTGINSSDHCILCFSCVRHCPHHSMHLDLRNPAEGVVNRVRRRFDEALFAVALTGTVLASLATPWLVGRSAGILQRTTWSAAELLLGLGLVAGYVLLAMLCSVGSQGRRWLATFTICGQAYLPLAFGGLFAIYFETLAEGGEQLLPLLLVACGLDRWCDPARFTPELGTLHLLTPLLLLAGTGFAWRLLGRLGRQYALNRIGLAGHRLLLVLTGLGLVLTL